jgi:hypothetical protein
MRRIVMVVLAFASSLLAQTDQDPVLLARLGNRFRCALVYSHYASGRPKLVIAGVDRDPFNEETDEPNARRGELALIRLPDSRRGHGVVVDRIITDDGIVELWFVHLIDRRDVVASLHVKHFNSGMTFRIRGTKLIEISDEMVDQGNVVDFDEDGVPEFVSTGRYCAFPPLGRCSMGDTDVSLHRWNGTRYVADEQVYAVAVRSADKPTEFPTPAIQNGGPKTYVLHTYINRRMKVSIDGRRVRRSHPFLLESGCHEIRISVPAGPMGYAFVEERPKRPAVRKR